MDEFLQVICHDGFSPQTSYGHPNLCMNRDRNYSNINIPPYLSRDRNFIHSTSCMNRDKYYIPTTSYSNDKNSVKQINYRERVDDVNKNYGVIEVRSEYFMQNENKRIDHSKFVNGKKRGPKLKKAPDRTFPCQLCTYSSTRKHDLKRHFAKIHHNNPNDKPVRDKTSLKGKTDIDIMENGKIKHSIIIKGKKRGPKMKHIYDKTYPCILCTYVSPRKFDLKRHVSVVHNKEKPFVCELCSFSAGLAETLKQHMLKMHNDTKFKCDSCNFTCAKKTDYMRHLKIDHNYLPYSCEQCNFTCLWNIELIQHKHKLHKNEMDNIVAGKKA